MSVNMPTKNAWYFVEERAARDRVLFSLAEVREATGLAGPAARAQLRRMPHVARVTPRGDLFLYIAPEHRAAGAPPFEWWLDACFAHWEEPYYVGLLSAAALLGSSHQAAQTVQVVISTAHPRRDLRVGRLRIELFQRKEVGQVPVFEPSPAHAPLRVSTSGATMIDLVRYARGIGGVGRVREVVGGLAPVTKKASLKEALDHGCGEVSVVQRLGFLLDSIGAGGLASVAETWLRSRRLVPILLAPGGELPASGNATRPWMVIPNVSLETGV
jgi:hypothetical protein